LVLAALLLRANEVVFVDRLLQQVWGDEAPQTAKNTLQVYVSRLRRLVGGRIATHAQGYELRLEPEDLDLARFERLATAGHDALSKGDAAHGAAKLEEALSLWRGQPLEGLELSPWLEAEVLRLEEARLAALEDKIEAELALGRHGDLIDELERLVGEHPFRERFSAQLMVALYRSGRQADALDQYRKTRQAMVEALGIEPGPPLRNLQRAILRQDPGLDLPSITEASQVSIPTRKQITGLLLDLRLPQRRDPEVASRRISPYVSEATGILEGHQAVVEKHLEEGLVASFGLPAIHEDDALRALRAAVEASTALQSMARARNDPLTIRIALESGEVLAQKERLLRGEAVTHLIRLRGLARDGEILIGEGTYRLVHHLIRADPAPGGHWRLVEVDAGAEAIQRHFEGPLVAREGELERLRGTFSDVVARDSCRLLTVVGSAGIGKSRLAREFAALVSDQALFLTGRCLPYGEGITFWPLVEIVRAAAGDTTARAIARVLGNFEHADLIAREIAGILGAPDGSELGEDAFWAVRKLFEALARRQPVVVVFEDIHWAEPRLLDLVEHVVDWSRAVPILIICLSRPELLVERPSWGGGKPNAESLLLNPLTEEGSGHLIDIRTSGVSQTERRELIARAEGNPLFIEQMLALLAEGDRHLAESLPPTIQAVLAARLDRLNPVERALVDCASVVGLTFWLRALEKLAPDAYREMVPDAVSRLAHKGFIRPARSSLSGEAEFRFEHSLIREVAYGSVLKETRAELHERFAAWLDRKLGDRKTEADETAGYHLEQAYIYRTELEPERDWSELALQAGERLAAAGQRSFLRSDIPAARNLLLRALDLLPKDRSGRGQILSDLAAVHRGAGDWDKARCCLEAASVFANGSHDEALRTHIDLQKLQLRLLSESEFTVAQFLAKTSRALHRLEATDNYAGLARAMVAWAYALTGQAGRAEELLKENLNSCEHDARVLNQAKNLLPSVWLYGATPVELAKRRCRELLAQDPPPRVAANCYRSLALLEAMIGAFEDARTLYTRATAILDELGLAVVSAATSSMLGTVELLADQPAQAERALRSGLQRLGDFGPTMHWQEVASLLARTLYIRGNYREAWRVTTSATVRGSHDIAAAVYLHATRAKLLARRGEDRRAQRTANRALKLCEPTDLLDLRADAYMDFAEVATLRGMLADADRAIERAVKLYERKGNVVSAGKARLILERPEERTREPVVTT
jgi:predicted ATPase/DNA-binding SARP family transcriptional activator